MERSREGLGDRIKEALPFGKVTLAFGHEIPAGFVGAFVSARVSADRSTLDTFRHTVQSSVFIAIDVVERPAGRRQGWIRCRLRSSIRRCDL
jgi:hypothetical protein